MAFDGFTQAQIAEITQLRNSADASIIGWNEVYQKILEFISDVDSGAGEIVAPKEGVSDSVWLFIKAAASINAGAADMSQVTRDYTAKQIEIRSGTAATDPQLQADIQQASDDIAKAVIDRIISEENLPSIGAIADEDASQAAAFLFGGDLGGWAGNPLFIAFGHDGSWRNNVLAEAEGTYDLLAAIVSGFEAFGNLDDWTSSISDLIETAAGSDIGLLGVGSQAWSAFATDSNAAFENAYGGIFPLLNVLAGNIVLGTIHDDEALEGSNDADVINSGAGDDLVIGSHGSDIIDGHTGTDTVDYSNIGEKLTIDLVGEVQTSAVTWTANVVIDPTLLEIDRLFNIEKIIGSSQGDILSVTGDSTDVFQGIELIDLGGNSTGDPDIVDLSGLTVGVELDMRENAEAGSGVLHVINAEVVIGTSGADTIRGGEGNESIDGGGGYDELWGGAGNDTFVLGTSGPWDGTTFDWDTIMDAEPGDRAIFGDITLNGGTADGYYLYLDEFENEYWLPIETEPFAGYQSADGRANFWKEYTESGVDLYIDLFDENTQWVETVLVKDWSDGDLGIHLALIDNRPSGGSLMARTEQQGGASAETVIAMEDVLSAADNSVIVGLSASGYPAGANDPAASAISATTAVASASALATVAPDEALMMAA